MVIKFVCGDAETASMGNEKKRIGNFAGLGLLGFALLALAPSEARATRVANFSAQGTSSLGANYGTTTNSSLVVKNQKLYSNCSVTISNSSSSTQNITYSITLSATLATNGGGAGAIATTPAMPITFSRTITLASAGTTGGANCSSSPTCTIPQNIDAYTFGADTLTGGDFPYLTSDAVTAQAESVSCYGYIQVNDNSTAAPGFVTASGTLTTFTEASPGVSTNANGIGSNMTTTTPSQTAIVISEGRPF